MSSWQFTTPVALIIFNRPDKTNRVFTEIANAKPPKLLVVADGPRTNQLGEAEKCLAARAVIDRVDWDCDVLTNFSDSNLGCKNRVVSGINWVFEQVPEAIILEDDCLPNPTFFRFCQELLERYRDDQRISMISGNNFQFGRKCTPHSYYFSRYNHIWGWASWRRAWKDYDSDISNWSTLKRDGLLQILFSRPEVQQYWDNAFEAVLKGSVDAWDYQWNLTNWLQNRVAIMPNINLVSNIGFGTDATHTKHDVDIYACLMAEPMSFPLQHPEIILPHQEADARTARDVYSVLTSIPSRFLRKVRVLVGRLNKATL